MRPITRGENLDFDSDDDPQETCAEAGGEHTPTSEDIKEDLSTPSISSSSSSLSPKMSARTLTKPIRRSYAAMIAGLASTVSLGQALLLKATYQSPPDARGPREGIERRKSMTFSASRGKVMRGGDSSSQIALASMGAMECTMSENAEEPGVTSKHPLSVLDEDPEVERHKILVIGDSLVSGVGGASSFRHTVPNGPALPRHVARYLSELLNVDVHWNALSLTGGDVRMLRKKVIPMLKREKERQANGTGSSQNMFSAVIVVTGFNDIKRISPVRTAKKFREDLESFIDQIREEVGKTCDIFLPSIPGVHHAPRFHEPLRSILIFLTNLWDAQKIALARRMKNVHFVGNPPEEAWTNNPIQFFSTLDRIHPSELGYEHWGERIAKDISRALKKSVEFGRLSAAKISDATSDAVHRVGEAASKAVAGTASIAEKTSSAVASNSTKGAEGLANCLKE